MRHYPFVVLCHNIFQKDTKRVGLLITRNKTCYYKKSRSRLLGMFYHIFDDIYCRDLVEYAEFNSGVHSFYSRWEIPFLGKFGSKNENCRYRLKFAT